MLKLRRVGVTGGIASGKTTVCQIFKELGAYVVFADQIVHHLLVSDIDLGKEVEKLLGPDCIVGGRPDRGWISEKVFNDPDLLLRFEQLVHPKVRAAIEEEFNKALRINPMPILFVVEVPLLFEAGFETLFDDVIAVIADTALCEQRYKGSDFKKRIKRHLPMEEKAQRSNYVIENSGDYEDCRTQVINLTKHLS